MVEENIEQAAADNDFEQPAENKKQPPFKDFQYILNFVSKIYSELGNGLYHSKQDIAKVNNLAVNSIKSTLSTAVQYRLLELKFGIGYKPTDLFVKIQLPENESEKRAAIIESLKSQDLYGEILNEYNGKVFPTAQGLTNILVRKYGFKEQAAQKITDTLLVDLRSNNLLNNSNVLSLNISRVGGGISVKKDEEESDKVRKRDVDEELDDLIEIVVPLKSKAGSGKRKAIVKLPEDYTDQDIDRIAKIVKAYRIEDEKE